MNNDKILKCGCPLTNECDCQICENCGSWTDEYNLYFNNFHCLGPIIECIYLCDKCNTQDIFKKVKENFNCDTNCPYNGNHFCRSCNDLCLDKKEYYSNNDNENENKDKLCCGCKERERICNQKITIKFNFS